MNERGRGRKNSVIIVCKLFFILFLLSLQWLLRCTNEHEHCRNAHAWVIEGIERRYKRPQRKYILNDPQPIIEKYFVVKTNEIKRKKKNLGRRRRQKHQMTAFKIKFRNPTNYIQTHIWFYFKLDNLWTCNGSSYTNRNLSLTVHAKYWNCLTK